MSCVIPGTWSLVTCCAPAGRSQTWATISSAFPALAQLNVMMANEAMPDSRKVKAA